MGRFALNDGWGGGTALVGIRQYATCHKGDLVYGQVFASCATCEPVRCQCLP